MTSRRNFWGWGLEGQGPDAAQQRGILKSMADRLEAPDLELQDEPRLEDIELPAPRFSVPGSLEAFCTQDPYERALHSYGRSYRDVVRGSRGEFPNPPDVVAYPRDENDIAAILDWCSDQGISCIPFGGGSSVVGGVEPPAEASHPGTVTLDLSRLDRVLEIDRESRAARIQCGVLGPALEDQLRPHGLTLRHFPQSFEFSTLGGWIATRSGGHYASLYTHIAGPHNAAVGMTFYTGDALPPRYLPAAGGAIIVAEHGSWNRPAGMLTGYRHDPGRTLSCRVV